jgi:hypothetical protein
MGFIVGGEEYDLDRKRVETVMRKVEPESLQKHLVELLGKAYPPKQVFAEVTGRRRATFTTQEAIRVLSRLGFTCREVGHRNVGSPTWNLNEDSLVLPASTTTSEDRFVALESGLATVQLAIAQLQQRIEILDV